jgi:formylglycine-generating enzyme required for sulfatase activity
MLAPSFANSIGMKFALIPAGSFMIGSADDDPDAYSDENSAHIRLVPRPVRRRLVLLREILPRRRPLRPHA